MECRQKRTLDVPNAPLCARGEPPHALRPRDRRPRRQLRGSVAFIAGMLAADSLDNVRQVRMDQPHEEWL